MSLPSLPTEILCHIAEHIESLQALGALARVNRQLHVIFDPVLYQRDARHPPSAAVSWAAERGMMHLLQKSINYGAEIPVRSQIGRYCISEGRVVYGKIIRHRFTDCPPPHPLCLAVKNGHEEIARLLLARGCDPNMETPDRYSLLSLAVIRSHAGLVKMLLSLGVDQKSRLPTHNSPIQIAAFQGNETIVDLLLHHSSQRLHHTSELRNALECALKESHKNIIYQLVTYGENLNTAFEDWSGKTPLVWASEQGDVDLVKLFLSHGADPNYHDYDHETALVKAAAGGHANVVSLLVGKTDRMSRTQALALSMDYPDGRVARILLEHGALPDFVDQDYADFPYSPHRTMGEQKDYQLIPPLVRAVNAGHAHLVRLLVAHGANVNAFYEGLVHTRSSRSSGSVLQLAMDLNGQDTVKYLRDHGAVVEVESPFDRLMKRFRNCTYPGPAISRQSNQNRRML
ncbi:uncharacterized protein CDV56_102349 [Aspergillus thermomutatus]|uniref:F-box domain-containing protein n=1 Tax=Aspergillus thermomutatus TaxID=41047 RepID=A0A397G245_ASPTH|nr:uncharacterized protein CDV56_102349 [Aspergillus thermomutatus]RHZ45035.1 hypothetical protein CDV56_102349 [Aspergillus thermomutatus]